MLPPCDAITAGRRLHVTLGASAVATVNAQSGGMRGGSGSMTGAATMPVSGTRHSKASRRPVTGDSGSQRSET